MLRKSQRLSFRERFKATFRSPGQSTAPMAIDGEPATDDPSNSKRQDPQPLPPPCTLVVEDTTVTLVNDQGDARVEIQDEVNMAEAQTTLSTSEQCWNDAYDFLRNDPATAEDVKAYIETLNKAFEGSLDVTEMEDMSKRPQLMRDFVEKARLKLLETSTTAKSVSSVFQFIHSIQDTIGMSLSNLPQAAIPWAGVCVVVQMLRQPELASKSNLQGITTIVARMDWYCALTDHLLDPNACKSLDGAVVAQLRSKVVDLYKYILLYQMKSICTLYRHKGLVFVRAMAKWDDWDDALKKVTDAEAVLQQDCQTYTSLQSQNTMNSLAQTAQNMEGFLSNLSQDLKQLLVEQREMRLDDADRNCRWALRVVDPRHEMQHLESKKDTLLPEAYGWFLETPEYKSFMPSEGESGTRLLHIQGHAGTGKTMLLMGIIRELEKPSAWEKPTPLYFFFQATESSLNNATAALRSLIWMLLIDQPQLIKHLRPKYDVSGPELFQDRNAYFALCSVLRDMLQDPELSPVVFILDAMDECSNHESKQGELVQLIVESLKMTPNIRWIITSRPEVSIPRFSETANWSTTIVDLNSISLQDPVNAYIKHKLKRLEQLPGYDEEVMQEITREIQWRSNALFLWVSLAMKQLHGVNGWDAIETVKSLPEGLSGIYDAIMAKLESLREQDLSRCKSVLSAVCLACRPMTLQELATATTLDRKMMPTVVQQCGSFLTLKSSIVTVIHYSTRTYLRSVYESKIQSLGLVYGEIEMATRAISAMKKVLKRNIYDITTLDGKPKEIRAGIEDPLAAVKYSVSFWTSHCVSALNKSCIQDTIKGLVDNVLELLQGWFLQWLESISLIGSISHAARELEALCSNVFHVLGRHELTLHLLDACKLMQRYGNIIDIAPLQAYASALVFSPVHNKVRVSQWHARLPFIKDSPYSHTNWSVQRHILGGHEIHTCAVAFSYLQYNFPLVSGDAWGGIQLWDPSTGVCWQRTKVKGGVNCFAFSCPGRMMASGGDKGKVYIFNVKTLQVLKELRGEIEHVYRVSFSADHSMVYSVAEHSDSRDNYLCAWELATGQLKVRREILYPWEVILASNSQFALLSHRQSTDVEIWDLESWTRTAHMQLPAKSSLALSEDQTRLATTGGKKIYMFELPSGNISCESSYTGDSIESLRFSPNGSLLVGMAHNHNTVVVWYTASLSVCQVIRGIFSEVPPRMSISPDNRTLALTQLHSVHLYNLSKTGSHDRVSKWGTASIDWRKQCLAISPTGSCVAWFGYDGSVRILDACTGSRELTSEKLSDIQSVHFAKSGMSLAVLCKDCVHVYNVEDGRLLRTLDNTAKPLHILTNYINTLAVTIDEEDYVTNDVRTITSLFRAPPKVDLYHLVTYPAQSSLVYSLVEDVTNNWIRYNGNGILWIPPGRKKAHILLQGEHLAFAHDDLSVTWVQIDESQISLETPV